MRKLTTYLEKKVSIPLLIIVFAVVTLLLLLQSLRFIDLILNKGFPATTLIYISAITLPSILVELLPVALILSIIFSWHGMLNSKEIVIMQSVGLSPWQITRSILLVGLIVSLITLFIAAYVIPTSAVAYSKLRNLINKSYNIKLIEKGKFVSINDNITFYVKDISANEFHNVLINNEAGQNGKSTIMAEKGVVDFDYTNNKVIFLLDNVALQEIDKNTGRTSFITLDKYIFDFNQNNNEDYAFIRNTTNTLYLNELIFYKNLPFLKNINKESPQYIKLVTEIGKERNRRSANSLSPLLFSIIAAYFFTTTSFNRENNKKPIIKIILICGIIKTLILICYFAPLKLLWASLLTYMPLILIGLYMFYRIIKPLSLQELK